MASSATNLPSVLVTGCSGFVGYHLIRHFVQDPSTGDVSGISRSAAQTKRQIEGAKYFSTDLRDHNRIRYLLQEIKPTVIIHTAAPSAITGTPTDYRNIIIEGTRNLLQLAKASPSVRVFVYTSTSLLGKGREHVNCTEDYPTANNDPKAPAYARAKATAEELIIGANFAHHQSLDDADYSGYLSTAALRFPIIYGMHDTSFLPSCLQVLQNKETNIQVGNGDNLWSYCSVENAVAAHLLLVHRLLDKNAEPVDGEIFNIHDGEQYLFWEVARKVWELAGHKDAQKRRIVLPVRLVLYLATIMEFAFWIFTFGTKRPQRLGKQQVEYACFTHTYSIQKAERRLGFKPKQNFDEALKEAVDWFLKEDGWGERLNISKSR